MQGKNRTYYYKYTSEKIHLGFFTFGSSFVNSNNYFKNSSLFLTNLLSLLGYHLKCYYYIKLKPLWINIHLSLSMLDLNNLFKHMNHFLVHFYWTTQENIITPKMLIDRWIKSSQISIKTVWNLASCTDPSSTRFI